MMVFWLETVLLFLLMSSFVNVEALICITTQDRNSSSISSVDYCVAYVGSATDRCSPENPLQFGEINATTTENLDEKCGVWRFTGFSLIRGYTIAACFCNTDECNTRIFAQDTVELALQDIEYGSTWAYSNVTKELTIVTSPEVKHTMMKCLQDAISRRQLPPPVALQRSFMTEYLLVSVILVASSICCLLACCIAYRKRKEPPKEAEPIPSPPPQVGFEASELDEELLSHAVERLQRATTRLDSDDFPKKKTAMHEETTKVSRDKAAAIGAPGTSGESMGDYTSSGASKAPKTA